jgi:thymidylate synthase (FAD)
MSVRLVWITPDAENLIVHMARVSNPASQASAQNPERLIAYLIAHKHWSPFEMAHACVEIETTRDIGRQILRHTSFRFLEFSQRYASTELLERSALRDARMQHPTNRQSSSETDDVALKRWWEEAQEAVLTTARAAYGGALERGIAKEVARAVLPEGLTPSRMYMVGNIRSWLHYVAVRTDETVQREHRNIASAIQEILRAEMPVTFKALSERLGQRRLPPDA